MPSPSPLRAAEQQQLLNLSQDAIMVCNFATNRIEFWNAGAEALYGYSAIEAVGRNSFELVRTEFPVPLERIKAKLRARRSWEGELTRWTKAGRQLQVNSRMWWFDAVGNPQFIAISRDLSACHSVEAELSQANQLLEERNREVERLLRTRERFIAAISHELRTPLNSILGFSSLLEESGHGAWTEQQRRFVEHIHRGGRHLLGLINEMLDLARIDAGRLDLNPMRLRLAGLAQAVLADVEPMARTQGVTLTLSVEQKTGLSVWADPARLRQILYNLLSNAIKFTPAGGQVWLDAAAKPGQIELVVGDTGIGIKASEHSDAFEEFWRATQAGPQSGAGLGLAITRRLVEAHGGSIRVESEESHGSRFFVTLPDPE